MAQYNQGLASQFKPETLPVGWPWRLFTFSLLLFVIALLSYLGLMFGYEPFLRSRSSAMDTKIQELNNQIPQQDEEAFIRFYSQLVNLETILANHTFSSKVFAFLEQFTHQKVYYTNLDFSVPERKLTLEGLASSYQVLGEQLATFDQQPMIERYLLNQSQFNEGLVRFKVILTLSPDLMK